MTPSQRRLFKYALGDGAGWPRITDDPEVNYEVDRYIAVIQHENTSAWPEWAELPERAKEEYYREMSLLRRLQVKGVLIIFRFN